MYYGYGFWLDPTYILVLIGVVICMIASSKMNATFRKYSQVRSHNGMTGREAAERILRSQGIYDVRIERVGGNLTDHYDPRNKVLRLSDATYNSTSVAAIGVAAHECGHAIQHATRYAPLDFRTAIVPVANIGASLSWPLFLARFILSVRPLLTAGIILFSLAVLFQLVTLPVEFNASSRALKYITYFPSEVTFT